MDNTQETIKKVLELAGFSDYSISADAENRKISLFINEGDWLKKILPRFVNDFDHLAKLMAKKSNSQTVFVDINNYRKERETLIVELAKAAARKAILQKAPVELPVMNAYERRLIHTELATRPDIKTESVGEGKTRRVIVSPSGL